MIVNFTFEVENRQRVEPYYLPAYMMTAIWIGFAFDAIYKFLKNISLSEKSKIIPHKLLTFTGIIILIATSALPCILNWQQNDRSDFTIARDYNESIFRTTGKNSIIFTSVDCTTFPMIYLIGVEQHRPDILLADKTGRPSDENATWDLYCGLVPETRRIPRDKIKTADLVYTFVMKQARPVLYYRSLCRSASS